MPGLFRGELAAFLLSASVLLGAPVSASAQPAQTDLPGTHPAYELRNGHWFDGTGFDDRTLYSQYGTLSATRPAEVDSVINLEGGWIVPPFAEAHNHNVEASDRLAGTIRRYLESGVFYVKNPNVLPASAIAAREDVNVPRSIDVAFAFGGFTGPGGHPIGVVQRNMDRGIWPESAGEGAFYFVIADEEDLERKWAGFLGYGPDFVKTYLLYSEEHGTRSDDPESRGWRGMDPALLPAVVRRAHDARLRVTTHVETAADFRSAVDAGVDEIAHLPGFRGNEQARFPDPSVFRLTEADARRAATAGVVVVTTLGDFGEIPEPELARALFRSNLTVLRDAGVRVAIGSDAYGSVGVDEAFQVRELGVFSDLELLRMWVEETPRTIFPSRRIGRLEPGWEASFLVLERNPLEDFEAVRDIRLRMKQGVLLEVE